MKTFILFSIFICSFINVHAQFPVYISTEKAHEDLRFLVQTFEEVHYNPYFKTTKEDFQTRQKELTSQWNQDSISIKNFMVVGMKLTAMLSGGHSNLYWNNSNITPQITAHRYIPFTGMIGENGAFVVTRSSHEVIEPGTTITAINGIDMNVLYHECMTYVGGIETFKNTYCEQLLPLYLFFNNELTAPYSISTNISESTIETNGLNIDELVEFVTEAQAKKNYTFKILEDNIGLLTYNSCTNYKAFKKFLAKTFQTIDHNNCTKLIIDITQNSGGDSSLNDLLLSYLTVKPYAQSSGRYWKVSQQAKDAYAANKAYKRIFGKKFMQTYMNTPNQEVIPSLENEFVYPTKPKHYFKGKICFLISANTFSSANFLADAVKTYQIAPLIGTATGEYTNDFGEQLYFTLPNSESTVFISSTFDIGANGDETTLEPVYPDIEVQHDLINYAIDWIKKAD